MVDDASLPYVLAFHRALGLTARRVEHFLGFFGDDWERAWGAPTRDLAQAGLDARSLQRLTKKRKDTTPSQEYDLLQACGASAILYGQPGYPPQLQDIVSAPGILLIRGEIREGDFPGLAVVGSRKLSSYGQRVIEDLVPGLVRGGLSIISGLAYGADTTAHKSAVTAGGRTLCVLGNGIDSIYPTQNRAFGQRILEDGTGAIISEYLPGTEPRPEHFPHRNRIVSGLSRGVLVVEAAHRSGSLITATIAVEQGREIFAVPGDIYAPQSQGTNTLLLKAAAHPAISAEQILETLGITKKPKKATQSLFPANETQAAVLRLFGSEREMHIDDLVRDSDMTTSVISAQLSILEIKGLVRHMGNQVYSRNI